MTRHIFPPRSILAATDMSGTSRAALDFARRLHERFGSALSVVHAHYFELPPYFAAGQLPALAQGLADLRDRAEENLRRVCREALGEVTDARLVERPPVEAILETAESVQADLIVVGTHGRRGAGRVWPGSVAEQVLRLSRRPVLAVRPDARIDDIRSILCPVASSPSGMVALDYAAQLAAAFGATLHALHAAEPGAKPMPCPIVDETVRSRCTVEENVIEGDAASVILRHAARSTPDVLIMGAEVKSSGWARMFSSTTQKVIQSATVPVFVVPNVAPAAKGENER